MVVPGVGPASNRSVIELGRKFRGVIFPALGFHPERFEHSEDDAREVLEMIASAAPLDLRHRRSRAAMVRRAGERRRRVGCGKGDALTLRTHRGRTRSTADTACATRARSRGARDRSQGWSAACGLSLAQVRRADHASDPQRRLFYFTDARSRLQAARSGSSADASCGQDSPRDRRPVAIRRPVRGTVDRAGDDQRSGRCDCASAMYDVRGNRHVDDGQCTSTFSNPRVN